MCKRLIVVGYRYSHLSGCAALSQDMYETFLSFLKAFYAPQYYPPAPSWEHRQCRQYAAQDSFEDEHQEVAWSSGQYGRGALAYFPAQPSPNASSSWCA